LEAGSGVLGKLENDEDDDEDEPTADLDDRRRLYSTDEVGAGGMAMDDDMAVVRRGVAGGEAFYLIHDEGWVAPGVIGFGAQGGGSLCCKTQMQDRGRRGSHECETS
jgi:hypothetical protein